MLVDQSAEELDDVRRAAPAPPRRRRERRHRRRHRRSAGPASARAPRAARSARRCRNRTTRIGASCSHRSRTPSCRTALLCFGLTRRDSRRRAAPSARNSRARRSTPRSTLISGSAKAGARQHGAQIVDHFRLLRRRPEIAARIERRLPDGRTGRCSCFLARRRHLRPGKVASLVSSSRPDFIHS